MTLDLTIRDEPGTRRQSRYPVLGVHARIAWYRLGEET